MTDPCIVAAGTEIYDPLNNEVIWREAIAESTYPQIIEALKDNSDDIHTGEHYKDGTPGSAVARLLDGKTSVVYALNVDPLEATIIVNKLQNPDLTVINMHSFQDNTWRDIHIHSAKASKEHAVAVLLDILKVKKEDSIVVGDGLNDLHLFVAGGTKVAMGNSVPELKAAADLVIKSVEEDGLAHYLESL